MVPIWVESTTFCRYRGRTPGGGNSGELQLAFGARKVERGSHLQKANVGHGGVRYFSANRRSQVTCGDSNSNFKWGFQYDGVQGFNFSNHGMGSRINGRGGGGFGPRRSPNQFKNKGRSSKVWAPKSNLSKACEQEAHNVKGGKISGPFPSRLAGNEKGEGFEGNGSGSKDPNSGQGFSQTNVGASVDSQVDARVKVVSKDNEGSVDSDKGDSSKKIYEDSTEVGDGYVTPDGLEAVEDELNEGTLKKNGVHVTEMEGDSDNDVGYDLPPGISTELSGDSDVPIVVLHYQ